MSIILKFINEVNEESERERERKVSFILCLFASNAESQVQLLARNLLLKKSFFNFKVKDKQNKNDSCCGAPVVLVLVLVLMLAIEIYNYTLQNLLAT